MYKKIYKKSFQKLFGQKVTKKVMNYGFGAFGFYF